MHGDGEKGEVLANQAQETGLAQTFPEVLQTDGNGAFTFSQMTPLWADKDYRRRMGSGIG